MNATYIMPENAKRKLKIAQKLRQNVYIYGASMFGKTELVRQFLQNKEVLSLSCIETEWELETSSRKHTSIVFIDDLHRICSEEQKEQIRDLIFRDDIWLILAGRCQIPAWLTSCFVQSDMIVISEQDLTLSRSEIQELAGMYGLSLKDEELEFLCHTEEQCAYAFRHAFLLVQQGRTINQELVLEIQNAYVRHIEADLLPYWDSDILDFLMQISVTEEFNLEMAELITGNYLVRQVIQRALETGNFITVQNGVYKIRGILLLALRSHALKNYGPEKMNQYMYSAGLYYESHNRIDKALELYEKSGSKHRIRELLIRNARYNPGAGYYFELRNYYYQLTEEETKDSPVLMAALSMLYSLMMQPEESEIWYTMLKTYAESAKGGSKREALSRIAYLDIALPHRGSENMVNILLSISKMMLNRDITLPEFSLTSNLPGVMNGGKDFCEWSKRDRELAASIGKPVAFLLGSYGKGIVNEALGESLYEKGEDDYEVITRLSRAQVESENGGKLELQFVVTALQVRLNILHDDLLAAKALLDSFEKKLEDERYRQMKNNLQALRCRLALYEQQEDAIEAWMQSAPDENAVFFVLERYRYLTKVRCYIREGQFNKAIALVEKIKFYARQCRRTYLLLESDLLLSIICYRIGKEWKNLFLDVLKTAYEYHFVRIISEEGTAVLPLLREIRKEWLKKNTDSRKWWDQLYQETENTAGYYPAYLNGNSACLRDFGKNAIRILQMQAQGMTLKQMAEELGLSIQAIKYHAGENYKKLGAKGKADAVQKARNLKII